MEGSGDRRDRAAMHLADAFDRLRLPLRWKGGRKPRRVHDGDAGFDLVCAESVTVEPGEFVDIDCDLRVELPRGTWGLLTGRSSTLRRRGLLVAQGVIDQGYRGPLFAGVWNLTGEPVEVSAGEHLAQLIPLPVLADSLVLMRVNGPLGESERGEQGFGSTGD
jgi:dUTP pyrophosphatase